VASLPTLNPGLRPGLTESTFQVENAVAALSLKGSFHQPRPKAWVPGAEIDYGPERAVPGVVFYRAGQVRFSMSFINKNLT